MNNANAFMKAAAEVATKKTPASKKASVKIAAEVTDAVKASVDAVIRIKAQLADLKNDQAQNEEVVIGHVRPQQDALARGGNFTKSLEVAGTIGSVLYNTSDKFGVPQTAEGQEALRKLLNKKFDEWLKTRMTIKVKESVQNDPVTAKKLMEALTKAGLIFGELFDVTEELYAVEGLDQKQYELPPEKLEEFRVLCRQNKPALK